MFKGEGGDVGGGNHFIPRRLQGVGRVFYEFKIRACGATQMPEGVINAALYRFGQDNASLHRFERRRARFLSCGTCFR
jgi:hypothetical protein